MLPPRAGPPPLEVLLPTGGADELDEFVVVPFALATLGDFALPPHAAAATTSSEAQAILSASIRVMADTMAVPE